MEFRQIEAFVNAVKYKSFSRAADATFLTQPTISAHINNLETELGMTLLNRSGREISLTRQGEKFYPFAVDMLNTRSQAMVAVQAMAESVEGVLDIHASSIPGQYYLPELLSVFHKKHPKVRYYVDQSDSKNVIESILNQKGEIGFTGIRGGNGLVCVPIFTDQMVLMTPDQGKFKSIDSGSTICYDDFKQENFVLREEGSGTKQEMESAQIQGISVFKNVNVIARMNSLEAIKRAVADGLGVSIVSRKAVEDSIGSLPLKFFFLEGLEKQRTFYLVYNKNICLSPVAEAFRNFVLEHSGIEKNND